MKALNKTLPILIVIALTLSVFGCSYAASMPMSMNSNGHMALNDHIDHAGSLILAIVPIMATLLLFFCILFLFWYLEIPKDVLHSRSLVYESPPIVFLQLFKYLFNPRSPPVS